MIHRRGTEAQRAAEGSLNELAERVIGAAIEVHRSLGPGLLESVYQVCFAQEMQVRHLAFEREAGIASTYKGTSIPISLRVDFLIQRQLIVEVKAVEALAEIHTAQLLTHLRMTDLRLGLLINFNVPALWRGVRRVANCL